MRSDFSMTPHFHERNNAAVGAMIGELSEREPPQSRSKKYVGEERDGFAPNHIQRDVLEEVFSFLQQEDLWEVGKVCKDWREVSQDDRLWKILKFTQKGVTSAEVLRVCRRHARVEELDLQEIKGIGDSFLFDLRSVLQNTKALVLSGPNSGASNVSCYEFLANLGTRCPSLRSLTMCADLRWKSSLKIVHPHLKELKILRPIPPVVPAWCTVPKSHSN